VDGVERGAHSTNRIIAALPRASRDALLPLLTREHMPHRHILYNVGDELSHLYFVESGLVALAKPMHDGRSAEIGAIGREGMVTPTGVFGAERAVMDSIMEIPGSVLRIERDDFRERMAHDAEFSKIIQRYVGLVMSQLTQTAACNILHSVEERCCRWLLAAHDSVLSAPFALTHEFMATLLGVRRASVQTAAAALQRAGFINYSRGLVTVTNRAGLEDAACECYATIQAQIEESYARKRADAPSNAGLT